MQKLFKLVLAWIDSGERTACAHVRKAWRTPCILLSAILASALWVPVVSASCPANKADTVFRDVAVVDVRSGVTTPAQDVAILDGLICAVTATDDLDVTATRIIEAKGHYLVPGLMEMHAHVSDEEAMTLYLANGVTTVRSLWGESWTLDLRRDLAGQQGDYPELVTAGSVIDGAPPVNYPFVVITDPRDADEEIARQAAAGYDFVKVYSNMSPSVFDAVLAAGKKYDIEVSGHLPHQVSFETALAGGMGTMEHFLEVADSLLRYPNRGDLDLYVIYPDVEERVAAIGRGEIALDDLVDRSRIPHLAKTAANSDTWFTPTLMPMKNFTSDWNKANPEWQRYLPPSIKARWDGALKARERWPGQARKGEDQIFALRTEILRAVYKAGGRIIAGTDAPVPGMYHGFSFVDELSLLSEVGLGNDGALRAGTLEAARYLGREGQVGEIVPGAIADLVLVKKNPLDDLQNLRGLTGVMKQGHWHTDAELQARLEHIAETYAAQEQPFKSAPDLAGSSETVGEAVRTTAVKLGAQAVDFVEREGNRAFRLFVNERPDGLSIGFAKYLPSDGWTAYTLAVTDGAFELLQGQQRIWRLSREGDVWEMQDGDGSVVQVSEGGSLLPLTGTPVDIELLRYFSQIDGTQSAGVLRVLECADIQRCEPFSRVGMWRDHGFEKINAVLSGSKRIELSVRNRDDVSVWVGEGPFYAEQPIRVEAGRRGSWDRLR